MKTTRGIRRRRGLGVDAHGVARDAWRPLALRWRRGMASRAHARARHVAGGTRVTKVSHQHLHLHVAIEGRAGRLGQLRAGVTRARSEAAARQTTGAQAAKSRVRVTTAFEMRDTQRRAAASVTRPVGERRMPMRTELRHAVTRPLAMRDAALHPLRSGAVPLTLRREPVRVHGGGVTNVEHHALQRQLMGAVPLLFVRANAPSTAAGGPSADRASMPTARQRPLDLVWRAPARAQVPGTVSDLESAPPSSQIRAERGSSGAASVSSSSAVQPSQLRALEYSQLPSALVDRLADDVLRRVERRVRIERERRGI